MTIKNFLFGKKKKLYDLDTLEGIQVIEIPKYQPIKGIQPPTENIEYILQRKATEHKRNGQMDLAIACLRKANEIFPHSNFLWSPMDYMLLVEYLKQAEKFDEAKIEEERITGLFQKQNNITIRLIEKLLSECKQMKTDLLISSEYSRACGECSKYSSRIFSISGKEKRFPIFPEYFKIEIPEHEYCINSFYPFFLGASNAGWKYKGDLINWCNRPFIDERSKQQKIDFGKWVSDNKQEVIDRKNYDFLREFFPEISPKSFGGFRRMKNLRSLGYLKLVNAALSKGSNLDELPDLSRYHF